MNKVAECRRSNTTRPVSVIMKTNKSDHQHTTLTICQAKSKYSLLFLAHNSFLRWHSSRCKSSFPCDFSLYCLPLLPQKWRCWLLSLLLMAALWVFLGREGLVYVCRVLWLEHSTLSKCQVWASPAHQVIRREEIFLLWVFTEAHGLLSASSVDFF